MRTMWIGVLACAAGLVACGETKQQVNAATPGIEDDARVLAAAQFQERGIDISKLPRALMQRSKCDGDQLYAANTTDFEWELRARLKCDRSQAEAPADRIEVNVRDGVTFALSEIDAAAGVAGVRHWLKYLDAKNSRANTSRDTGSGRVVYCDESAQQSGGAIILFVLRQLIERGVPYVFDRIEQYQYKKFYEPADDYSARVSVEMTDGSTYDPNNSDPANAQVVKVEFVWSNGAPVTCTGF